MKPGCIEMTGPAGRVVVEERRRAEWERRGYEVAAPPPRQPAPPRKPESPPDDGRDPAPPRPAGDLPARPSKPEA